MSIQDEARELADWFVAAAHGKVQKEIAEYVRRGRRLAATPLDQVRAMYIDSFRQWAVGDRTKYLAQDTHDAEYELTIRGEPIPYEEIRREHEILCQRTIEVMERAKSDPEMMRALMEQAFTRPKNPN